MLQQISDETSNASLWRGNIRLSQPSNYCYSQVLSLDPSAWILDLLVGEHFEADLFTELDAIVESMHQRIEPVWSEESEELARKALQIIGKRRQPDIGEWSARLTEGASNVDD